MPDARNYPWDILAIDETDDKKVIKKAYAALIKQYKPDEHPEKFQEIQTAYKFLLKQLISSSKSTSNQRTKSKITKNTPIITETKQQIIQEENLSYEDDESEHYKSIIDNVHKLMDEVLVVRTNIENWKFIEKYYKLDNLYLKESLSENVFEIVAEKNIEFYNRNKQLKLTNTTMGYLFSTFDWNHKWDEYQERFSEESLAIMFSYQESDSKDVINSMSVVSNKQRFKYFRAEFFFSYSIAVVLFIILDKNFKELIELTIYILLILRVGFELLFKASLVKMGAHAFITDTQGNKCSRLTLLIRHLIINLTFLPIYNWVFDLNIPKFIWLPLFVIMLTLNVLSFIFKSHYLHDLVTKTIVVEMKGEFEY